MRGLRFAPIVGVALAMSTMPVAAAPAVAILPDAEWEVVDQLDSPSGTGTVVALTGARALLTGADAHDTTHVFMFDAGVGLSRVADAPAPLEFWPFAAALADGRVLVGGGSIGIPRDRNNVTDRCFIYDPDGDTWTEVDPLPQPSFYLYGNTAVTLHDGRVMVSGGSTPADAYLEPGIGDQYLASRNVFLFDPATESWSEGAPMPVTRVFATYAPAFFSPQGIPLGAPDTPPLAAEAGRSGHDVTVLANGHVIVVGGRSYDPGSFSSITPIDEYNPETDTWARIADLPAVTGDADNGYGGRGLYPGVTVLPTGHVLIFGGSPDQLVDQGANGHVFSEQGTGTGRKSTLDFDPGTGQFRRVGDLNYRRRELLAASWIDGGGAFAIGGASAPQKRPLPNTEVYDPVSEIWSVLPLEPDAGFDFSPRKGVLLSDSTVLTWSALPFYEDPLFGGPGGLRSLKVLHPAGL